MISNRLNPGFLLIHNSHETPYPKQIMFGPEQPSFPFLLDMLYMLIALKFSQLPS